MDTSIFLAKLIGLYAVIMALLWAAGGSSLHKRVEGCINDSGFLVLSGFFSVIVGLAILVGHHVWEANWRVAITILGYLALLKGIILLGWPSHLVKTSQLFFTAKGSLLYLIVVAPLGGWLAWLGFTAA